MNLVIVEGLLFFLYWAKPFEKKTFSFLITTQQHFNVGSTFLLG